MILEAEKTTLYKIVFSRYKRIIGTKYLIVNSYSADVERKEVEVYAANYIREHHFKEGWSEKTTKFELFCLPLDRITQISRLTEMTKMERPKASSSSLTSMILTEMTKMERPKEE